MPWFKCKDCGNRAYSSSPLEYLKKSKCQICGGELKKAEDSEEEKIELDTCSPGEKCANK